MYQRTWALGANPTYIVIDGCLARLSLEVLIKMGVVRKHGSPLVDHTSLHSVAVGNFFSVQIYT